jgi:hypothetical protein
MITATMVSNDGKTAEFDVTMAGETRRICAEFLSASGLRFVFETYGQPLAVRYATGTKRHACMVQFVVEPNGVKVYPRAIGKRYGARVYLVGFYDAADPRNSRNNLA